MAAGMKPVAAREGWRTRLPLFSVTGLGVLLLGLLGWLYAFSEASLAGIVAPLDASAQVQIQVLKARLQADQLLAGGLVVHPGELDMRLERARLVAADIARGRSSLSGVPDVSTPSVEVVRAAQRVEQALMPVRAALSRHRDGSGGDALSIRVAFAELSAAGEALQIAIIDAAHRAHEERRRLHDALVLTATLLIGAVLWWLDRQICADQRAAVALADSEARLRLSLEAGRQGLFDLDLINGVMVVNDGYARMLGYDHRAFHASFSGWRGRLHPDDRGRVLKALDDYLAGRCVDYRAEYRASTADGRWLWLLSVGRVIERDADGRPRRLVGTHTDITALKLAEQRERHLNRLYVTLSATNQTIVRARSRQELLVRVCEEACAQGGFASVWIDLRDGGGLVACGGAAPSRQQLYAAAGIVGAACRARQPQLSEDGELAVFPIRIDDEQGVDGALVVRARTDAAIGHDDVRLLAEMAGDIGYALDNLQRQAQLRLAAQVFDAMGEGLFVADPQRRVQMVNPAFAAMTGYSVADWSGSLLRRLAPDPDDAGHLRELLAQIDRSGHWQGEICARRQDGAPLPLWLGVTAVRDAAGRLSQYVGVVSDLTERKAAQARIDFLARHDGLTGLPNRELLRELAALVLAQARREGGIAAVLSLDVDRFKILNDLFGPTAGDCLLACYAERLLAALGPADRASRVGGDEFVLLLGGFGDVDAVVRFTVQLMESLAQPVVFGSERLQTSTSIGIAVFPDDGSDFDALQARADTALAAAKSAGRGGYRFAGGPLDRMSRERLAMEQGMREALRQGEFWLAYQPQLDLHDGHVLGAEALLRWRSPSMGELSPGRFIPVAEESGLIVPIGVYVLEQACRDACAWPETMAVAVNLSALQFASGDIVATVEAALAASGLPAQRLELELTESLLLSDAATVAAAVERLRALGVRFSIDDFGTGYSSLTALRRLAVSRLKIDRSFVMGILDEREDRAIVEAVIQLGRGLGLRIIAEGAEQPEQLELLRELGCDEVQGYVFARPMPAAALLAWLPQVVNASPSGSR